MFAAQPVALGHAVIVVPVCEPGSKGGSYARVLALSGIERAVLVLRQVGVDTIRVAAVDPEAATAHLSSSRRLAGIEIEVSKIASVSSAESLELFDAPVPFLLVHADRVFEPKLLQTLIAEVVEQPEVVRVATGETFGDVGVYYCPAWISEAAPDANSISEALHSSGRPKPVTVSIASFAWKAIRQPSDRRAAASILMRATRKPTDGPVSRLLNRRLSGATSRLLIVLGVTPNMATTLVFALGFVSAWYAMSTSWVGLVWAGVWFQLASVWDGCDGEIARVTLRSSKFGAWYDTITDNIRYTLFIVATGIGLFRRYDMVLFLICAGLFLLGAFLVVGLMTAHLKRSGSAGTHLVVLNKVESSQEVSGNPFLRLVMSVRWIGKQDVMAALIAGALVVNLPWAVLFGGVITVFCMLALILPVIGPELLRPRSSPRSRTMRSKLAPLLLLAGAVVLVALVVQFDLADVGQAWSTMGWAALATPLIALLWFGANTTASHALFGARVPWLTLFLIRLMGEGYNALLPKAGIAGEPIKVQHLTAYVTADRACIGVVLDRLLNMLSGLVVSGALIAASLVLFTWPAIVIAAAVSYIALAAVGAFVLARALRRDPAGIGAWVLRRLGHGETNRPTISGSAVVQAFVWHLFGRMAMALEVVFLLYLLDLDFGLATVIALTGVLSAAGAISFIIPQSLGVAEAAAAFAFFLVGFPPVLGVAFGLVRRGRALLISMLGVGVHVLVGSETAALEDSQQVPSSGF